MKIIFLDIDGVLNYQKYFISIHKIKLNYNKYLKDDKYNLIKKILELDIEKLFLIKEICDITNSKIVITSSWKILSIYPFIHEYLIKFGLPIIDETDYIGGKRGQEIKEYLINHSDIDNYIIIDDDIFPDFDEELLFHLIHTNFYDEGINYDNYEDAIFKLKKFYDNR